MSIDALKDQMPEYAKDIKLNLGSLASDHTLNPQQLWGCFLAAALSSRNANVIEAVATESAAYLSPEVQNAVKAAAAVMAMNNIYYRFVHLASNHAYQTMPAKLRMNIIANPGVDKTDFELWSLVVSAVNGCGMCIDSHEQHLAKSGMSGEGIQTAVRIAATIHAAACVLDAEAALKVANLSQVA